MRVRQPFTNSTFSSYTKNPLIVAFNRLIDTPSISMLEPLINKIAWANFYIKDYIDPANVISEKEGKLILQKFVSLAQEASNAALWYTCGELYWAFVKKMPLSEHSTYICSAFQHYKTSITEDAGYAPALARVGMLQGPTTFLLSSISKKPDNAIKLNYI